MSKYTFASEYTAKQRKTFAERLLTLANILEETSEKEYDHYSWMAVKRKTTKHPCGTVACAFGHAAANRRLFPGLRVKWPDEGEIKRAARELDRYPAVCLTVGLLRLNGSKASGDDILIEADRYFGTGSYEAIFSGAAFGGFTGKTPKPQTVVKRIREYVAQRFGYEVAA